MSTEAQAQYCHELAHTCKPVAMQLGFDREQYPDAQTIMTKMSGNDCSKQIDKFVKYLGEHWSWRPGTKKTVVSEFFYQYAVEKKLTYVNKRYYDRLLRWIRDVRGLELQDENYRPLIFTRNEKNQDRVPVDMEQAEQQFLKQCSIIKDYVNARLAEQKQEGQQEQQEQQHEENLDEGIEQEQEIEIQEEEKKEEKDSLPPEAEELWNRYVEIRTYVKTRDVGGPPFDTLERRPLIAGAKMIVEGISVPAIIWAMAMHYPESNLRELNIEEYDVKTFKPENQIPGMPPEFPYLDALYRQRINPWLISPAGVGKTTVVKKFADHYGQPMCAIPLNRGTTPGAFNGRIKVNNTSLLVQFLKAMGTQNEEEMTRLAKQAKEEGDVTLSEFVKVFKGGGHILLDELDAADENLLMMVNMPLANGRFANTAEGKTYEIHPDTLIWAASNTMGLGVSAGQGREYRGRNALDFATIDRFRMGRVKMEGDLDDYRNMYEDLVLAYS
jgi:hypothetical protein